MPLYSFKLREGAAPLSDDMGTHLPDRECALAYANEVVRELMQGRALQTRTWRLDVFEDHHECVFELPFAAADDTLNHLAPEHRRTVERVCESSRSLREVVHVCRATVRESRAAVARSRGEPYLATVAGEHTIRRETRIGAPASNMSNRITGASEGEA